MPSIRVVDLTKWALFLAVVLGRSVQARNGASGAGIFGTTCWTDKANDDGSSNDCEEAIKDILSNNRDPYAALSTHSRGCVEVGRSGGCAVSLCDTSDEKGVTNYGAIKMAAQDIHAVCKGNPSTGRTGGFATVAGMGIPGVRAVIATVELGAPGRVGLGRRDGASIRGREPTAEMIKERGNIIEVPAPAKLRIRDDDDQIRVPGTNHKLFRTYAQNHPDFDGEDLTYQDQNRLRDRLVTFWNQRTINPSDHPTVATARVDIGSTRYTLAFLAYNNADLHRVALPNRLNMIDAFFTLRGRNQRVPIFETEVRVDNGPTLGLIQLIQFNMDALEDPFADPDDEPFADPPDNPNGTDPFADPTTVPIIHIEGCY